VADRNWLTIICMEDKREPNRYLCYEFGVEGDEASICVLAGGRLNILASGTSENRQFLR
jgi:hypothetical protein